MPERNVTPDPENARSEPRYALYRLCDCFDCTGTGKYLYNGQRCVECRGEGKVREVVAEADTEGDVGVALVTLGREGEWSGCAFGLLDREGATNEKWLVKPWLPSPRNVSDAGRVLAKSKHANR